MLEIPGWVIFWVGAASVVHSLLGLAIIIVLAIFGLQIRAILNEIRDIVKNDVHREMMPEITGTLRNVKSISDDAAKTTHQVTNTVNHVSHVVDSVTHKLESPVIKTVGVLTGALAGARALSGEKDKDKTVVVKGEKKRGGLLGFLGR